MTTGGAEAADRRGLLLVVVALGALACAYLGRALAGEAFVSTETVYRTVEPWSGSEAATLPRHNENLADQPTVWLPMQAATRAMVRDWFAGGEPPLWCPQSYCGAPWLGNMSSALFSPFTWLFVALPFVPAFALCAAAKWLLAGTGAWLLARRLGIAPAGRLLAAVAWAFCGFQVVWIDSCLTNVSVWAPWLLLAIERVLARPDAGPTAALALASWQVLVGGHPETSLYVALGAAVYAACRWFSAPARSARGAVALAAGAALGGVLAVAAWWPFLEYAFRSFGHELRGRLPDLFHAGPLLVRAAALAALALPFVLARRALRRGAPATGGQRALLAAGAAALAVAAGVAASAGSVRPTLLLELLPDWFGRSLNGESYGGPFTYQDVVAGFCGGALFLLALAAALVRFEDGGVRALVLVALVAGARTFRIPLLDSMISSLPQVGTTAATRALVMVALPVALLAGFALDELRLRPRRLAACAGGLLLFLAAFAAAGDELPFRLRGEGPSEARADGPGFHPPGNLADPGPSGLGCELGGLAPAGAARVRILVNGREMAVVAAAPPTAAGLRPFSWRWVGSHRLEGDVYELRAEALDEQGGAQPFDSVPARCERHVRPGARWAVHLGAIAAVLLAALFLPWRARAATVLLAASVELLHFGVRYNATTPPGRLPGAIDPLPALARARAEHGPLRVFTARTHLHPNLHLLFDVDVLRGYDALEPVDYIRVLDVLYRGGVEVPWLELDFTTLDFDGFPGADLADVLNVRYALSAEPPPHGWREVWRRATAGPPLALHENPDALPRAFTVQRALGALDAWARREDLRTLAAWDEPGERAFEGRGRVAALDHRRGRIRATVESDAGTILVVSENFGGWRATLDGAPAEIRRTHGTLLSVVVPAGGRREVELVYRPLSALLGAAASGGGLLALLALAAAAMRARPPPAPLPERSPGIAPRLPTTPAGGARHGGGAPPG